MKKKLSKGKKRRRKMMLDVVETQIQQNNPPETKLTLERLMKEGYSRDQAIEFIATAVVSAMHDMLKQQEPFNRDRFVKRLSDLPKLPWDE